MKLLKTHLSRPPNDWSFPVTGLVLLVFLGLSLLYWRDPVAMDPLTAGREAVFQGQEYWRLFTTIAIHADLRHLLANSIFFYIFGYLLHSYFGSWVFPALSLAMGGVANYFTLKAYPAEAVLIGASGVVYFMAGLWATLYFFIERRGRAFKRFGVTLCVVTMLFFPTEYEPNVSYLAHLWGFVLGIVSGILYFYSNRARLRAAEVWKLPEPDEDPQWTTSADQLPESLEDVSDSSAV